MRYFLLAQVICLFSLSFHLQADYFTFVVADNEPPLSSSLDGQAVGIIPDIIKLTFEQFPEHQVELKAFPWARAQVEVEQGRADGFLTYPSTSRQQYANFSSNTIYKLDFGYLIYNRRNVNRHVIESAKNFNDLKNVTMITQTGAEWESDNIPDYIPKVEANNLNTMFHLLFLRKQGDFLIMPLEQATHMANSLGYKNMINYRHVDFINDSMIPFHLGIRKTHPLANDLIAKVDEVVVRETFLKKVHDIVSSYR